MERALAAAAADAGRISDLLEALRRARLWLPLPADGRPAVTGDAVTLPTVSYLGSEFVPAYSSELLLQRYARPGPDAAGRGRPARGGCLPPGQPPPLPHAVVRAADLARLLPPSVGIALNAGAPQSVPVYPQGVSYLAAGDAAVPADDPAGLAVGPLPARPGALLAAAAAALAGVSAARAAAAAWLSARSGAEGLLIAVTLDDPSDPASRDRAAGAVERAAWQVEPDEAAFPISVAFPGEREADRTDEQIAAVGTPFYQRA